MHVERVKKQHMSRGREGAAGSTVSCPVQWDRLIPSDNRWIEVFKETSTLNTLPAAYRVAAEKRSSYYLSNGMCAGARHLIIMWLMIETTIRGILSNLKRFLFVLAFYCLEENLLSETLFTPVCKEQKKEDFKI